MSVLLSRPHGWVIAKRPRSLLSQPGPVLGFMALLTEKSTYPSAIYKAMAISARCQADAKIHGEAELASYWEDVLCAAQAAAAPVKHGAVSASAGTAQGKVP